jgi:hypothetical protein
MLRSRAIHPVGVNLSCCLNSSYHPAATTLFERCRYHLLRNVIPTLLIVVSLSWIVLLLTAQIDKAKLDRQDAASLTPPQLSQTVANHAHAVTQVNSSPR